MGWQTSRGKGVALTPHERAHGIDEIDGFGLDARAVLRAAAEGGLVLLCVAPADWRVGRVSRLFDM